MDPQFKKNPPRKKEPVRGVSLTPEAKKAYEDMIREKDERAKSYETHLAPPIPRK
ncbi:hypothetical protein [Phreatobacter aquaticus]|uniref:hypothetical protein n=1 Tax=Phreatobacter aquaticus TaxID=2570229 RepID=UPI00143DD094|nr:hypothetical protein [Phreatobacter aquaticus]